MSLVPLYPTTDAPHHRHIRHFPPLAPATCDTYRGTSLMRNNPLLEPYSRTTPRVIRWSWGGGVVSYERGIAVTAPTAATSDTFRTLMLLHPSGSSGSASSQHRWTPELVLYKGHASFRITSSPPPLYRGSRHPTSDAFASCCREALVSSSRR